jgi:ElaB/YqjD/DUF883 family membrane-anchored ribosome-binding protein
MASATLDQLESEVERARARFADDLARLRDPVTMQLAKTEMLDRARAFKDDAVDQATAGVTSRTQELVEDLKQKLSDNPTAAVLIGAGIAWHLFKNPPITSLLVGSGLFALFRPDVVDALSNRVSEEVQTRIASVTQATQETASDLTERVGDIADQAGARMSETLQPADEAAHDFEDVVRQRVEESPLLYSLAAAAVGAAIGVTARRRGTFTSR